MHSPKHFQKITIDIDDSDEFGKFCSWLDIQDEIDQEDFALSLEQDIVEFLSDELFKD